MSGIKSLPDPTGLITALYARVTQEESRKKGLSIPNQCKRFYEVAEQHGWEPAIVYEEDKAVSGQLDPSRRPALQRLLDDARAGKIARVVCRDQDRVGRGDVTLQIYKELHELGIEVWEFNGPVKFRSASDRFQVKVQAAVGDFEVERCGERVREARRGRAHEGIHCGPAPYGYTSQSRLRRQYIAVGLSEDAARVQAQQKIPVSPGLIVDEAEAAMALEIFNRYVARKEGTRAIARDLNDRGVRRRGGVW